MPFEMFCIQWEWQLFNWLRKICQRHRAVLNRILSKLYDDSHHGMLQPHICLNNFQLRLRKEEKETFKHLKFTLN